MEQGLLFDGWLVEPVAQKIEPRSFDFLAPETHQISLKQAWDLFYIFKENPNFMDVEPSFVVSQDNVPSSRELELAPEAFRQFMQRQSAQPPSELEGIPEVDEKDCEWNLKLIKAKANPPESLGAWDLEPSHEEGRKFGEGIRIAHPDSGIIKHFAHLTEEGEWDRVLVQEGHDFVGKDPNPVDEDGEHGLATSSVIISAEKKSSRIRRTICYWHCSESRITSFTSR